MSKKEGILGSVDTVGVLEYTWIETGGWGPGGREATCPHCATKAEGLRAHARSITMRSNLRVGLAGKAGGRSHLLTHSHPKEHVVGLVSSGLI